MNSEIVAVAKALRASFDNEEIPEGFIYNGQTFEERCEAWAMHALEQLEDEIEAQGDIDEEADEQDE